MIKLFSKYYNDLRSKQIEQGLKPLNFYGVYGTRERMP